MYDINKKLSYRRDSTHQGYSRSLLVNNTNWHLISYCFSVIMQHWSNYCFWQGVPLFDALVFCNSAINHLLPKTRFIGHFCCRQCRYSFNQSYTVGFKI